MNHINSEYIPDGLSKSERLIWVYLNQHKEIDLDATPSILRLSARTLHDAVRKFKRMNLVKTRLTITLND